MKKIIDSSIERKVTDIIQKIDGMENKIPHNLKTVFNFPGRKSVDIAEEIISNLTSENDIIYDPFMGSGSFVIAAIKANRKIIANEIDNYTCSIVKILLKKIDKTKLDELFNLLENHIKQEVMNLYETECCSVKNYISKLYYDPETNEYFHPIPNREIIDGMNIKLSNVCPVCHKKFKIFEQLDLDKINSINTEDLSVFPHEQYIENSRINITASTGADMYDRLFTKRNQKALLLIQQAISELDNCPEKDILEFSLVASLALSRIGMYGSSTDRLYHVVLNRAQETNVWEIFESKVRAFTRFKEVYADILNENTENNSCYKILNSAYQDFTHVCENNYFDLIYTDFPYTDQVPYLEWNQMYRIWLQKFYDSEKFLLTEDMLSKEIVQSNAPSRLEKQSIENYFKDIDIMFKQLNKVLKEKKLAVFTVKLGTKQYFQTLVQIINLARKNGFEYISRIGNIDKNDPTIRKQAAYKNTLSNEMIIFFQKLPNNEKYWYIGDKNFDFETTKIVYNKILKNCNQDLTLSGAVQTVVDILLHNYNHVAEESDKYRIASIIRNHFVIEENTSFVRIDCNRLYLDIESNSDLFNKLYDLMPIYIKKLLDEKQEFVLDDLYFELANSLCNGDPNTINQFLEDRNYHNNIKSLLENYCSTDGNVYQRKTYINQISEDATDISCLSGTEFELVIKRLLDAEGYTDIINTGGAGDLGVDLIAKKIVNSNTKKFLFQCKRWVANVGSEPIQRLHSEKIRRGFDEAICITTSDYTRDGLMISEANNIIAINGREIAEKLNSYFPNEYYNGILEN